MLSQVFDAISAIKFPIRIEALSWNHVNWPGQKKKTSQDYKNIKRSRETQPCVGAGRGQ